MDDCVTLHLTNTFIKVVGTYFIRIKKFLRSNRRFMKNVDLERLFLLNMVNKILWSVFGEDERVNERVYVNCRSNL